jgi:hypothetical protein
MSDQKRRIIGLCDNQNPGEFFHFKLADGGRVHIPPDHVMRMWNKEQNVEDGDAEAHTRGYLLGFEEGKRAIVDAINSYVPPKKAEA